MVNIFLISAFNFYPQDFFQVLSWVIINILSYRNINWFFLIKGHSCWFKPSWKNIKMSFSVCPIFNFGYYIASKNRLFEEAGDEKSFWYLSFPKNLHWFWYGFFSSSSFVATSSFGRSTRYNAFTCMRCFYLFTSPATIRVFFSQTPEWEFSRISFFISDLFWSPASNPTEVAVWAVRSKDEESIISDEWRLN